MNVTLLFLIRNPGVDKLGAWMHMMLGHNGKPTLIKELKPNTANSNLINLFDKTCEGIWNNYY